MYRADWNTQKKLKKKTNNKTIEDSSMITVNWTISKITDDWAISEYRSGLISNWYPLTFELFPGIKGDTLTLEHVKTSNKQ